MKKLLIIILILAACNSAQAAVNVTSASITEGVLTIGGSWETDPDPGELVYDDFSDGVVDATIGGDWSHHAADEGFAVPQYSDTSPRVAGGQFIRNTFITKTSSVFYLTSQTTSLPTYYISCYMRIAKVGEEEFLPTLNYKYIYVTASATSFSGANPRSCYQGNGLAGSNYLTILDDNAAGPADIGTDDPLDKGWLWVEFWGKESSGDTAEDGMVWQTNQDTAGGTLNSPKGTGAVRTRVTDHWINAHFGIYEGATNENDYYHDYSEVYFANKLKRVIITDNASWSASTEFAIQPQTARSTTEITATFNIAGLTPGTTGYVFVFDEDNTVNGTGYSVTLEDVASTATKVGGCSVGGGNLK